MYDASDFENFYTTHIEPSLPGLRADCKRIDNWGYVLLFAGLALAACLIGFMGGYFSGWKDAWLPICFAGLLIYATIRIANSRDKFTDDLKEAIIVEMIKHICPGSKYQTDKYITEDEYKASSLFRYRYDIFFGDDLIQGTVNNVSFRCSELHTQADGGFNIFNGLFFSIKINPRFHGGTYVWPWDRVQLPTSMMDEEYRLMPMPNTADIKTGDSEFENYYRVCSNSPKQAQEILSEKMMDNMLRLAKGIGRHIAFSFVTGRCYVAITFNRELLDQTDYDPGDKIELKIYYDTISLIPIVIRRLELEKLL